MNYTLKQLQDIVSSGEHQEWGEDFKAISSVVTTISSATCSPCAMRRYRSTLQNLLSRHGDSLDTPQQQPTYRQATSMTTQQNRRQPCIECVRKHLSQAYVLQGEFYSGYKDYLGLIDAHLTEALEECPKDNPYLLRQLNRCLAMLKASGTPTIPLNLCLQLSETSKNTGNESKIPLKPENLEKNALKTLISGVPDIILLKIRNILDKIGTFTDKTLIHAEISGRLACSAEMFAPFSPRLTEILRARRLSFLDDTPEQELYGDILDAINDKLGGVESENGSKTG